MPLANFLDKLITFGRAKNELKIKRLPGEAPGHLLLVDAEGKVTPQRTQPHPRTMTAGTIADLVDFAINNVSHACLPHPAIFYGRTWAELVFNTEDSAERMRWQSEVTRESTWFHDIANKAVGQSFSVNDCVQLFDTMLRETMPREEFLKQIGRLKIVHDEEASTLRDANSSMTGGITTKKVVSGDDSPLLTGTETFSIRPLLSEEICSRLNVEVYIRADLDNLYWWFVVSESEWNKFRDATTAMVGTRIMRCLNADETAEHNIPVICGDLTQMQPLERND